MSSEQRLPQPTKYDVWFLPLGGTGQIGMNMNLYGHAGQWLMVDCGMGFDHSTPVERRVCADPEFIEQRKDSLQAIVITHAHEDHIGAIANLWPRLQVPIYATSFAAALLLNKLSRVSWGHAVPVHEVQFHTPVQIGEFEVTWLPMAHSVPEAASLLIETDVAKVLHTGDWKADVNPVVGEKFSRDLYAELGSYQIDAMICDSTNATKQGVSVSESACYQGLYETIKNSPNRVVVGCFSSNIARLVTLARIAERLGRKMAVFGRSMETMLTLAKRFDYWPKELEVIDPQHIGYLPRHEVLVVATGSQAEPRAALSRLAFQRHPWLYLEADDTVIFSAIKIPPNEERINRLINQLRALDVEVIHAQEVKDSVLLHASGHPTQADLQMLMQLVKPACLIPTHGEMEHLAAFHALAERSGIETVLSGVNGDLFKIHPFKKRESAWVKCQMIELSDEG